MREEEIAPTNEVETKRCATLQPNYSFSLFHKILFLSDLVMHVEITKDEPDKESKGENERNESYKESECAKEELYRFYI